MNEIVKEKKKNKPSFLNERVKISREDDDGASYAALDVHVRRCRLEMKKNIALQALMETHLPQPHHHVCLTEIVLMKRQKIHYEKYRVSGMVVKPFPPCRCQHQQENV